mgnify:CR=1 FL=1
MFCPQCRSEFIEGIFRCPECRVQLVKRLPEVSRPAFVDYKEVLSTFNPADIAFLKSLLDSEGIQYFFKGEQFMYIRPFADPARLMIRVDQAQEAMELIKDVKLSFTGINPDDKRKDE